MPSPDIRPFGGARPAAARAGGATHAAAADAEVVETGITHRLVTARKGCPTCRATAGLRSSSTWHPAGIRPATVTQAS